MKIVVFYLVMCFGLGASVYAQHHTPQADSINRANALAIKNDGQGFTKKAAVAAKDSIIEIYARLGPGYKDYRAFGYAKPDTLSKKMILISLFTSDVKGNPFDCPFGAFYDTDRMRNATDSQLKYLDQNGNFVKAAILKNHQKQTTVYIEKKWVDFEKADR